MIDFLKKNMDYFKKFVLAFAIIVVYKTFDNISSIFSGFGVIFKAVAPFFTALIIAYMLNLPIVKLSALIKRIKKPYFQKHSYGLSVLIVYILAVAVIAITISAIVPALYMNLYEFTFSLPAYVSQALEKINSIEAVQKFIGSNGLQASDITNQIKNMLDFTDINGYVGQLFSMTSGVLNGFIAVIGSVYMLLDKERIIRGMKKLTRLVFRNGRAEFILDHAARINVIFTKYIYCRLICSVICGTVCGIVLSILRVKYALVLAIFIGAMDMIPYFGSIISCVVAIVVNLITGGLWQTVWVAAALLVIQQLDGNLLAPKLMGDSLELRPLSIVVAVFVGGKLFGFLGMLLSVPILAVIRAMAADYIDELQERRTEKEKVKTASENGQ